MTYNTGNAVGSADPRDLYDNAQALDEAVNGQASTWTDRRGVQRPSWAGLIAFQDLGAYGAGITLSGYNQIVLYSGEYYKVKASTALPFTTSGTWAADVTSLVSVGDAALRANLKDSSADDLGAALVAYKDPVAAPYLKTVSDIINGLEVSAHRFLDADQIADAQAGTLLEDVTSRLEEAHAAEVPIFYPRGTYKFSTFEIPKGGIRGEGIGLTRLYSSDAGADDLITFTGTGGDDDVPLFRDFKIQAINSKTAGAALRLLPSTGAVSFGSIENIATYNVPRGIDFSAADHWTVAYCRLINYSDAGIFVANSADVDSGDSTIIGCLINTAKPSGLRYGIAQESSAGLKIVGNKILGGAGGYVLSHKANTQSGPLLITGNSIENVAGVAIYLGHAGGYTGVYGGVVITGNEIDACTHGIATDTSGLFTVLTITGNYVGSNDAAGICAYLKGTGLLVDGNTFRGGLEGLRIDAGSTGKIGINQYIGNTTALINTANLPFATDRQSGIVDGVAHTTAFGSLYHGSVAVTFPAQFKTIPTVDCSAGGGPGVAGGFSAYPTNITTSGFTLNVIGNSSGSTNSNRWKADGVL